MIKLAELLDESDASEEAARLGLDFMSFGRYGKDGKVTHKSKNGRLVPVDIAVVEPLDAFGNEDEPSHARNNAHLIPRMPNLKKRIKTRISPKRFVRHNMGIKAPKGLGMLTNPEKMVYNAIYNFITNKVI